MQPQGGPGRRTRIEKDVAERARGRFREMLKPNRGLGDMEIDELVVLLSDVSGEITSRGGSDVLPLGISLRLRRTVE